MSNFSFTPLASLEDRKKIVNDIYKNSSYILKNIIEEYYNEELISFLTDLLSYYDYYSTDDLIKINHRLRSLILQYDFIIKNFNDKILEFFINKI